MLTSETFYVMDLQSNLMIKAKLMSKLKVLKGSIFYSLFNSDNTVWLYIHYFRGVLYKAFVI